MASVKSKVPKLRFKGFSEEWQSLSFARALHEVKRPIKMQNDTDYQLITVKRRNEGIVSRGIFKGKDVLVKSQFEVKKGDYIISKRQVVHGANGILPETLDGSIVSNEYLVAKGTDKMDIQFFSILSSLPIMYKQFFLSSYGIDIEKLFFDVNDWKKRTVNVPILKEQTQIGDFFQKLDQVIEIQQNALTQAQNYKKAMLQKMFPQKGEKVPKVRFKGFSGDWVEKKLGSLVDIYRGLTYKPENIVKNKIGIRVLRSSNINENTLVLYPDDVFVDSSAVKLNNIQIGDILITAANGSSHLVGKHAVIENELTDTVHGGFMLTLRAKVPFFVNSWMNTYEYKMMLQWVQGGNGAIGNLSKPLLEQCKITLPVHIKEQTQIGNFFQQLDKQITEQQNKLTHYQTLKKAMLQRLFI